MPRQSGKKDRVEKAQRRLARAQLDLHAAQEKRAQAIARGEHEIERARQRAAAWTAKATERVEKRSGAVARAEARLITITTPRQAPPAAGLAPAGSQSRTVAPVLSATDPAAAGDLLERHETAGEQHEPGGLVLPEGVDMTSPDSAAQGEPADDNNLHPW